MWCEAFSFMPGARVRALLNVCHFAYAPFAGYLLKLMFSTSCINVRQSMSGLCCLSFLLSHNLLVYHPVSALCTIYALDNAIFHPDTKKNKNMEKPGPAGTIRGNDDDGDRRSWFIFGVQLCMDFIVKFQDQARPFMQPTHVNVHSVRQRHR